MVMEREITFSFSYIKRGTIAFAGEDILTWNFESAVYLCLNLIVLHF